MIASTSSITSKYASLLVYLTPERLHGIAVNWPEGKMLLTFDLPVTVFVMVRSKFGGLISSFSILDSVAKGKPESSPLY